MTKIEIWELLGGLAWLAGLHFMLIGISFVAISGLMHMLGAPGK